MPQAKKMSTSGLDAMAREQGFPSYAAWKAHNEKYRKKKTVKAQPVRNFFQSLIGSAPHQGTLINKVTERIRSAKKDARNVRPD